MGWSNSFSNDMNTLLPRKRPFADDREIWEMAKLGGFALNAMT